MRRLGVNRAIGIHDVMCAIGFILTNHLKRRPFRFRSGLVLLRMFLDMFMPRLLMRDRLGKSRLGLSKIGLGKNTQLGGRLMRRRDCGGRFRLDHRLWRRIGEDSLMLCLLSGRNGAEPEKRIGLGHDLIEPVDGGRRGFRHRLARRLERRRCFVQGMFVPSWLCDDRRFV